LGPGCFNSPIRQRIAPGGQAVAAAQCPCSAGNSWVQGNVGNGQPGQPVALTVEWAGSVAGAGVAAVAAGSFFLVRASVHFAARSFPASRSDELRTLSSWLSRSAPAVPHTPLLLAASTAHL